MRKNGMIWLLAICLLLSGCASSAAEKTKQPPVETKAPLVPEIPEKLTLNQKDIPVLNVFQVDEEKIVTMDIETYLQGVLAGEMKNDWPLEALKAQAILARTFVLKFCSEKESKYEGADISTDIEEAQAYDETGINENIIRAVDETKGMVLSNEGELPYAWFHAHSGGMTALAKEGLGYEKDEPEYTQVISGGDSEKAPKDAKVWSADFDMDAFTDALKECGLEIDKVTSVKPGDRGESGRMVTILVNDKSISAPQLRIALGSSKMRSTLLTSLKIQNGKIHMAGKGYGHGVGMPQWGAYAMAEDGKTAEQIALHYFRNVSIEKMW